MKALILGLALLLSGCASFKAHDPFRNPDGTLDVMKILQYVQYGIDADCQFGQSALTDRICTYGKPAVAAAMAVANRDPTGAIAATRQALMILEAQVPEIVPYLDWALKILK
jgi:hypothetical protein